MIRYVAGLMFDLDDKLLVMIEKSHPEWMSGRLNAVGGKIETGETSAMAMSREFQEETGLTTKFDSWELFLELRGPRIGDSAVDFEWVVEFFMRRALKSVITALDGVRRGDRTEPIRVLDLDQHRMVQYRMMPNLDWIIPMALDEDVEMAFVNDSTRAGSGRASKER